MTRPEDASRPGLAPGGADPLIGRVIGGNFRVGRLLGVGAMGGVYHAEQISLGKAVAIKVLHRHLMNDENLAKRFHREAKAASTLDHPNSIQIIDFGQDADGMLYIAMELLVGRDLARVIREDFPMPLPRVTRIMSQVLAALDEAHAHGIVHRDLKPGNIMLVDRRGETDFVKVCDFGIAKVQETRGEEVPATLTMQGVVCGTPEYMAPEQARGEPLDGRADLYAAAVILYQIVTGELPFRAESALGILTKHLTEPPEPPSRRRPDLAIDPALEALILRGMAKDRAARPATAAELREQMEAICPPDTGRRLSAQARPSGPTAAAQGPAANAYAATAVPGSGESVAVVSPTAGTTPQLPTAERAARPRTGIIVGGALLALAVAGAAIVLRDRGAPEPASARIEPLSSPPGVATERAAIVPAPSGRVLLVAEAPPPSPATAPEPAAVVPSPAPGRRAVARARPRVEARPPRAASPAGAPVAAAPTAPPVPPAAAAEKSSPRGPREIVAEGEDLLKKGGIAEACARGEEARRLNAGFAPVHKFLARCYNRAGKSQEARASAKKFLELAPNAPDAFVYKSMIK